MMKLIFFILLFGALILFFSSSPYFGLFGVLIQSVGLTTILCVSGCTFFGLLVVLMYMGGMLIVFLFSMVMSSEEHPYLKFKEVLGVLLGAGVLFFSLILKKNYLMVDNLSVGSLSYEIFLSEVFSLFFGFTMGVAMMLLVALVSVLCMNFEHDSAPLRWLYCSWK